MKLQLKNYHEQLPGWPTTGRHIMAQYDQEKVIVYQAYRPAIGHFAATYQRFGGAFKMDRMTWIKPNFLWMMYRSGWGTKEAQEVTLAIHLKRNAFEAYLKASVKSSFDATQFSDYDSWKQAIDQSDCRIQWDPDHDPHGEKLERRAVQIGLRRSLVSAYVQEDILEIEDISDFVKEQREHVNKKELQFLIMPDERVYKVNDKSLVQHLNLDTHVDE
ncbi:MAG: DUF4291 domain-containing protein [Cytophagales bacterium]|nr:DUF4291 domain-containing protein [Cytophagales bacterium]